MQLLQLLLLSLLLLPAVIQEGVQGDAVSSCLTLLLRFGGACTAADMLLLLPASIQEGSHRNAVSSCLMLLKLGGPCAAAGMLL
jgi:hypothetical protein